MTHKSRTDSRRVFKLGSKVGHVTRHAQQLFKVTKSRDVSRQKRYNSAVYGHINFKLGGNYRHGGRRVDACGIISTSVLLSNSAFFIFAVLVV